MLRTRLLPLFILFGLLACSNPTEPVGPLNPIPPTTGGNVPGTSMPVGTPNGSATSQTIGPSGGTLTSADGSVSVRFPAGALAAATTVQLQPVTNTAPVSTSSPSVAILPATLSLQKPIEITFKKSAVGGRRGVEQDEAELGWVAQQRADGVWEAHTNITETATGVTVSIVKTGYFTHFYPYVIEAKNLSPWGMLVPNEPVHLLVRRNFVSSAGQKSPVVLEPLDLTKPEKLLIDGDNLLSVAVNGVEFGTLHDGFVMPNVNTSLGYTIQYAAPQQQPRQAPVRITATFRTPESGTRTATTRLSVGNDCRYTFNGQTTSDAVATGSFGPDGLTVSLQSESATYQTGFRIPSSKPGTYPFKAGENMVSAGDPKRVIDDEQIWYESHSVGGRRVNNDGSVVITAFELIKGFPNRYYVRGTCSGTLTRPTSCGDKVCWEPASVNASFAFVL